MSHTRYNRSFYFRDESFQAMIALVLTTKQQPDNAQKHNITMTNKLVVVKKNTKTHTKRN